MPPADPEDATSLDDVRAAIDDLNRELVRLLARRGAWVERAAAFKTDEAHVRAPDRVKRIIDDMTTYAGEVGADPTVTERVFTAMIEAFIDAELATHRRLSDG
ncbi:MAG: chorismate mutase [Actinomycetota bacterium]|nr:chorismate mutase [Actinomycetota bacterium]